MALTAEQIKEKKESVSLKTGYFTWSKKEKEKRIRKKKGYKNLETSLKRHIIMFGGLKNVKGV
jgi:hypothetical protein